jgi:nucleotide-binding universal stress UspA family protein
MYKRILVPIDGSETATLGLNEALELARCEGGSIHLVHVVDELIFVSSDEATRIYAKVVDMLRTAGEALLKEAESVARRAGVAVDAELVEAMGGQAGDYIIQKARQWRADLIVCGTHGRRGIRRLVMGSDAEYIVRHTPVPVLLVRSLEIAGK